MLTRPPDADTILLTDSKGSTRLTQQNFSARATISARHLTTLPTPPDHTAVVYIRTTGDTTCLVFDIAFCALAANRDARCRGLRQLLNRIFPPPSKEITSR